MDYTSPRQTGSWGNDWRPDQSGAEA